jgi:hypothetical protein
VSLASAQNTEERKGPRKARRGMRVPFSLVRFYHALWVLWASKENEHVAFREGKREVKSN